MKQDSLLTSWLTLLRIPNLFTVPGDPLAGIMLSMAESGGNFPVFAVLMAILTSLCLYSAGLILNDVADYSIDSVERPQRPLPSGKIGIKAAIFAAVLLAVLGVCCGALVSLKGTAVSSVLFLLILLYNFVTEKIPLAGYVNMSLCRAVGVIMDAVLS